jgi:DNA-binding CsgD family transcriptional regulator
LTRRERQIAALVSRGHRNKEIADRLCLREGTVKVYLSRVFTKTGAGSRHEFAMQTMQRHLDDIALRLLIVQRETAAMGPGEYGRPNVPELAQQALQLIQELKGESCESPSV